MASLPSSTPSTEATVSPTASEAPESPQEASVVAVSQPLPEPTATAVPHADSAPGSASGHLESDEEAIARLAALSPFEYGRVRKAEAKALGIIVKIVDERVKEIRD
jgi:hypothetical protein